MEEISITCNLEGNSPEEAIIRLLNDKNISYKKFDNSYFVLVKKQKSNPVLVSYKTAVEQETIYDIDTNNSFLKPIWFRFGRARVFHLCLKDDPF